MTEKKTISINSNIFKALLFGIILGALTVFISEHFGNFSFIPITNNNDSKPSFNYSYSYSDKISQLYLTTPFGSNLTFSGENFTVLDLSSEYSNDYNKYTNKVKYYFAGTKADFQYIIYFGIGFSLLIFFVLNYRIKIK